MEDDKLHTKSALTDTIRETLCLIKTEDNRYKYTELIDECIATKKIIEIDEQDLSDEIKNALSGLKQSVIQEILFRVVKEIYEVGAGNTRTASAVKEDRIKIKFKGKSFGNTRQKIDLKKELNEDKKDDRRDSKKLYDFAVGHLQKMVISTYDSSKAYGLIHLQDHWETIDLGSQRAVYWLSHEFHQVDDNVIHSQDFFKNALHAITANAQMNGTVKEQVHIRTAQTDDAIYYDLGSSDYTVIKISKDEISKIKINEDTPLFVRPSSLFAQVEPTYDDENALDKLVELLLIRDENKIIFMTHLIASFLESCATPMVVITGSADSGKSTFVGNFKRVVDPSGLLPRNNLVGFPKKPDDLISIESNRYMISFDNVSDIDQEMSDELCRSITGGSSSARKLYTNSDESISSYRNKICLNGIVPTLNYPDLQTRIINYTLKKFDETNKLGEDEFEEKFQSLLPNVLGCIFKTLQKALSVYPTIRKQITPTQRLADFEIWGESISQSLGYERGKFQQAYDVKLKEDTINAKESHIIVDLIVTIMEEIDVYENQAKILLQQLRRLAEEEEIEIKSKYVWFPKIPNQLTKELTVIEPILNSLGFHVENYPYNKRDGKFKRSTRIVRILRKTTQTGIDYLDSGHPPNMDDDQKKSPKTSEDERNLNPVNEKLKIDTKIETDEDVTPSQIDETITRWECITCGTGIRDVNETSKGSGNILKLHQKSKRPCIIKYYPNSEE